MTCRCGCNQESRRNFLPGHDQKLRASLERRTGNLLGLEKLVNAAESFADGTQNERTLSAIIQEVFAKS